MSSTYINLDKNIIPDYEDSPLLVQNYITYIVNRKNLSIKTANAYFIAIRMFLRYLLVQRNVCESKNPLMADVDILFCTEEIILSVTAQDIDRFTFYCSTTLRNSPSAVAQKISAIKSFYKYLRNNAHLIEVDPAEAIEPAGKKGKTLPVYLTEAQCRQLLYSVNTESASRDYCIIFLFLTCGMRISELVGIDMDKVFYKEGYIRILGKGNKERLAYLNPAAKKALAVYLEDRALYERLKDGDTHALFVSQRTGRRLTVRAVQLMVEKALKKAGLSAKQFSPHKFRHTAASLMYQAGTDIVELAEILGHESISTTQIYAHIDNSKLADAVASTGLAKLSCEIPGEK